MYPDQMASSDSDSVFKAKNKSGFNQTELLIVLPVKHGRHIGIMSPSYFLVSAQQLLMGGINFFQC